MHLVLASCHKLHPHVSVLMLVYDLVGLVRHVSQVHLFLCIAYVSVSVLIGGICASCGPNRVMLWLSAKTEGAQPRPVQNVEGDAKVVCSVAVTLSPSLGTKQGAVIMFLHTLCGLIGAKQTIL